MSDTPTLIPGTNPAGTPVEGEGDPLAPPDDLGASVIAEFARREQATAAALGKDLGNGPPGGFPDINDAAANVTARFDVSQVQPDPATSAATPTAVAQSAVAQPEVTSPAGPSPASGDAASEPGGVSDAASTPAQADVSGSVAPGVSAVVEEGVGVASPAPSGYSWTYHDGAVEQTVQFDDSQVQRALGVAAWAENLPEPVRQAIGSIETGQAVAIPRADFDEYAAWKAQQSRTSRDADLNALDLDPGIADIVRKQRDEIDALKAQQQPAQPYVDPQYQTQVNTGINRTASEMDTAMQTYAQTRGLTNDETRELLGVAVNAQIMPTLVEANTQFNPANGTVLVPANMAVVTEQALDWALIRNPHLKTRVLAGQQPTGQIQQGAQLPPPALGQPAVIDPVQARKARAGSLATAPSGAAPPMPAQTVQQMTPQDITAAMARDIEAVMHS